MRIKFRYTGMTDGNFTNNQLYLCVGFVSSSAGMLVGDAGLVVSGQINGGSQAFDLVSVTDTGDVVLFEEA